MAEDLAKETRKKDIANTIVKLCRKRLDYNHRKTYTRRASFKGRLRNPLFQAGEEQTEFQELMEGKNEDIERPESRKFDRRDKLRPMVREENIDFNVPGGRNNMGSQMSQSMESEIKTHES